MALDPYEVPDPEKFLKKSGTPAPPRRHGDPAIPTVPDPGMVDVDEPKRGDDVDLEPLTATDVEDGDDVGEVELAHYFDVPSVDLPLPESHGSPATEREAVPALVPQPPNTLTEGAVPDPVQPSPVPLYEGAPLDDPFAGYELETEPGIPSESWKVGVALAAVGVFVVLSAACLLGVPALLGSGGSADAAAVAVSSRRTERPARPSSSPVAEAAALPRARAQPSSSAPVPAPPAEPSAPPLPVPGVASPTRPAPMALPRPAPRPRPVARPLPRPAPRPEPRAPAVHPAPNLVPVAAEPVPVAAPAPVAPVPVSPRPSAAPADAWGEPGQALAPEPARAPAPVPARTPAPTPAESPWDTPE